jgi:hypothetical protein
MKQGIHAMARATAIAITISSAGPAQAQTTSASPFQTVEASIDDIHTALRSGRLTTRQMVQSYLDRINAYDKQGPNINSVITINPNALAEAGRLDAAFPTSRSSFAASVPMAGNGPSGASPIAAAENTSRLTTSYYISNLGNNSNNGRSPSTPWLNLAPVQARTFGPNDQILFQSGGSFTGCVTLTPTNIPGNNSSGTFTIGTYGTGAAPIIASDKTSTCSGFESAVIRLKSLNGIIIHGLTLRNGAGANTTAGINVQAGTFSGCTGNTTIENNDIGGFDFFTSSRGNNVGAEIEIESLYGNACNVIVRNNTLHGLSGTKSLDDNGVHGYGNSAAIGGNQTGHQYYGNLLFDIGGAADNNGVGSGIVSTNSSQSLMQFNLVHNIAIMLIRAGLVLRCGRISLIKPRYRSASHILTAWGGRQAATEVQSTSIRARRIRWRSISILTKIGGLVFYFFRAPTDRQRPMAQTR